MARGKPAGHHLCERRGGRARGPDPRSSHTDLGARARLLPGFRTRRRGQGALGATRAQRAGGPRRMTRPREPGRAAPEHRPERPRPAPPQSPAPTGHRFRPSNASPDPALPQQLRVERKAGALAVARWLPCVALGLALSSNPLLTARPAHHCRPDPTLLPPLRALSGPALLDASVQPLPAAALPAVPTVPTVPTVPAPDGTRPCTRGWLYALPVAGLRRSPVTQWNLVCGNSKVPLQCTGHRRGWLLGSTLLGAGCDHFDCQAVFVASLVLATVLGAGKALAARFPALLALQLHGGALAGASLALCLELCNPRPLVFSSGAGLCWVLGALLLPLLAVLVQDWCFLQRLGALMTGLLLLFWGESLLPEFACWLLATGQVARTRRILHFTEASGVDPEHGSLEDRSLATELAELATGSTQPQYHLVLGLLHIRVAWRNALILGISSLVGGGIQASFLRSLVPLEMSFYLPYFLEAGLEAAAIICLLLTTNRWGCCLILLLETLVTGLASLLLIAGAQCEFEALEEAPHGQAEPCGDLATLSFVPDLPGWITLPGCRVPGPGGHTPHGDGGQQGFFLQHTVLPSLGILALLCILLLPATCGQALPVSLAEMDHLRRCPLLCTPRPQDHLPLLLPSH
ncbi:LOW QUALITY PROTEIN: putative solute carrier family 22 member 31 [Erethizon dorsatum]